MSELNLPPGRSADDHNFGKASFFRRQLPFLAILTLAIAGVAYTNISHQPLVGYWEFLALAMGVVCVVTEWAEIDDRQARFRLMWTQTLHWAAVLVTMNIMLLSGVQQLLPTQATSLVLLTLLALGTFLAGLNLLSLQICFLGLAMVLAVPAISWVKQSALFLLLAAVFLIGLGMTFWSRRGEARLCFIAIAGAAVAFLCMASAVTAEPRDSVERGQRMDTDAIRDDVRTNRLQIPAHPLAAEQTPQRAPTSAAVGDGSAKNTNAASNRGQRINSRRRPRMHAMPRGPSDRQIQLRQQQEKSR
jgi:hypothetical protein